MDYKVCVLRAPGTNCDLETAQSIEALGLEAQIIHVNRFLEGRRRFSDFEGLIIPGGFSFGDHVRAGALLGKRLKRRFQSELEAFSEEEKPILGICNGFQVLVETGLLPGGKGKAALTTNLSSRFECRWVHLNVARGKCLFTRGLGGSVLTLPVAHGEGRFLMDEQGLDVLKDNGQALLTYSNPDGQGADGSYPLNPNGALHDIAGISNEAGNVLGLMPHPERAFYGYTHPRWTKEKDATEWGDGYKIFKNMADYVKQ